MRGIFVGIPDDAAGWLFYVPTARTTLLESWLIIPLLPVGILLGEWRW